MNEVTTYLLKLEKSEKDLWKEHAKIEFSGNLAQMIRTFINRAISGNIDQNIGISQDQIDKSINSAIAKSSLSQDVNILQDKFDQLAGYLSAILIKDDIKLNELKEKGGMKFDF